MVFALANPTPEVHPDVARRHAAIVATGPLGLPEPDQQRPGLPRHLPRARSTPGATRITEAMKLAAAQAIADLVPEPTAEMIVPSVFQEGVAEAVAAAVRRARPDRRRTGTALRRRDLG